MENDSTAVLPRRQFDVAWLVSKGLTNREVAGLLAVSAHTVRNTLRVVFEKLEVSNRVELAVAFAESRVRCADDRQDGAC